MYKVYLDHKKYTTKGHAKRTMISFIQNINLGQSVWSVMVMAKVSFNYILLLFQRCRAWFVEATQLIVNLHCGFN